MGWNVVDVADQSGNVTAWAGLVPPCGCLSLSHNAMPPRHHIFRQTYIHHIPSPFRGNFPSSDTRIHDNCQGLYSNTATMLLELLWGLDLAIPETRNMLLGKCWP
jgi:hypothetical protein